MDDGLLVGVIGLYAPEQPFFDRIRTEGLLESADALGKQALTSTSGVACRSLSPTRPCGANL
jgi:hypothetical protein